MFPVKTSISKTSEFAGDLQRRFINFRPLGCVANALKLTNEREAENPQIAAQVGDIDTAVVSETTNSPAKIMSVLQKVPFAAEKVTSK